MPIRVSIARASSVISTSSSSHLMTCHKLPTRSGRARVYSTWSWVSASPHSQSKAVLKWWAVCPTGQGGHHVGCCSWYHEFFRRQCQYNIASKWVRYRVIPLLVAMISTGAMSPSRARLRNEKHSISNMWTSSMNRTCRPETDNSFSQNTHMTYPRNYLSLSFFPPFTDFSIDLISYLGLDLPSVSYMVNRQILYRQIMTGSPENNARNPWERLLMTSISCRLTVCTTSLRFCSSPSGHWTNFVCTTQQLIAHYTVTDTPVLP